MKANKGVSNEKIKIIPLGGLEHIGMNITCIEYEDSIIVIDCGLSFPDEDMLGVDLVIPDVTYLKDNLDNILKMIDLGAYVQFDTIGKNSYYPDEKRIAMLHALRDRGLLNRVMLSMDITRRSHLKANGGYGYDYLLTTFIPQLRQSGFSQADVDVMLRENPSQFFQ